MNKTLLAVAVALAYSVTPAWADGQQGGPRGGQSDPSLEITVDLENVANQTDNRNNNGERNAKNFGDGNAAANNGSTASTNFSHYSNQDAATTRQPRAAIGVRTGAIFTTLAGPFSTRW